MNAPWPSEIWPLCPVRMSSPRIAMKYAPTVASCTVRKSLSTNGRTTNTTTPAANAIALSLITATPWSLRRSYAPRSRAAEEPGRAHEEHREDDRECCGEAQRAADPVHVRADEIEQHAEQEAADDGADRGV